jgi:hypothetical protein
VSGPDGAVLELHPTDSAAAEPSQPMGSYQKKTEGRGAGLLNLTNSAKSIPSSRQLRHIAPKMVQIQGGGGRDLAPVDNSRLSNAKNSPTAVLTEKLKSIAHLSPMAISP